MNVRSSVAAKPEEAAGLSKINRRRISQIIDALYKGIVHSRGLYAHVKIETHAPQNIYYPGSKKLRSKIDTDPVQETFITSDDDRDNNIIFEVEHETEAVTVSPGTLEHRRWLWFATLTDRREDSLRVYEAHCKIYADHPEFYTPEVSYISLPVLRKSLERKYKIGSPRHSVEYWQICAFTLFSKFGGDPVALLRDAGWSVEKVYAWKQQQKRPIEKGGIGYDPIPGWGRKLLSLYFLYLSELGYPLPDDAFASDVHAQAFVLQTRSFEYGDRDVISSTSFAEIIRKYITEYCKLKKYDVVLLAHASWLLGSTLCDQCSKRSDAPTSCVIYEMCDGRIDTSHYWKNGKWPKNLSRMNKGGDRPPFGVPTDVTPRLSQRGHVSVNPTVPLFPLCRIK